MMTLQSSKRSSLILITRSLIFMGIGFMRARYVLPKQILVAYAMIFIARTRIIRSNCNKLDMHICICLIGILVKANNYSFGCIKLSHELLILLRTYLVHPFAFCIHICNAFGIYVKLAESLFLNHSAST